MSRSGYLSIASATYHVALRMAPSYFTKAALATISNVKSLSLRRNDGLPAQTGVASLSLTYSLVTLR